MAVFVTTPTPPIMTPPPAVRRLSIRPQPVAIGILLFLMPFLLQWN